MALGDLLSLLSRQQAQAEDWQQYYAGRSEDEELQAVRDAIALSTAVVLRLTGGGLIALAERRSLCAEPFKLRLACLEDATGLAMSWHVDRERIPSEMMEVLADRYARIAARLSGSARHRDRRAGDRRRTGTDQTDAGTQPYRSLLPVHSLMHSPIEAQAKQQSARPWLPAVSACPATHSTARPIGLHGRSGRRGVTIGARVGPLHRSLGRHDRGDAGRPGKPVPPTYRSIRPMLRCD
ncbi:MAG: hypothetical protein MRJ92_08935 [Nitrospira sp.]|nr:hypothetical protein [Nitrospira sp.]